MPLGLLGKKLGHTRVYDANGAAISVTVVLAGPNRVIQVKTQAGKDGYNAVQLGLIDQKEQRVTKPLLGHFKKHSSTPVKKVKEFRDFSKEVKPGDVVGASLFLVGDFVDAIGVTKGRGWAGTIKRHNFGSQRASHGNSRSHNVPGSISMAQDPGRVFPGKKMTGHMGDETVTTQNLDVVRVDEARQLLLVKGAVPGSKNGHVVVRPAVKVKKGAQ